jgi:predicted ABC-type ATPase
LGTCDGTVTPALLELVSEQLTALKYEIAAVGIDVPRDPFANYEAMAAAAAEFRARKDYVAAVRNVIVSIVVQRATAAEPAPMRQSPGPQQPPPPEIVEVKAPAFAVSPPLSPPPLSPPTGDDAANLSSKVTRSHGARRGSNPQAYRTAPAAAEHDDPLDDEARRRQSLARHIAVRREAPALSPETVVAELRLQNAQLMAQRNDELTQATLLWQDRFVQMQRDVKSLEQELERMQDANASLESEIESARATNATLKRQLYTTLEMINGHGERVQSYAMKVAVLEQSVENVERAHTRGFVQQFFWTALSTTLSIITVTIAAVSGAIHIVSDKVRGRPVDSRATLAKAVQMAQQATVEAIDGAQQQHDGMTDSGDLTLSDSAASLSAAHKSMSTPPGRITDAGARLHAAAASVAASAASTAGNSGSRDAPSRVHEYAARTASAASPARSPANKYFAAHPTSADTVRGDAASLLPPPIAVHAISDDLRRRRPKSNSASKPKLSDFIDDIEFGQ